MSKMVIRVVVILAVVIGAHAALENQAERMLQIAQEMYQDGELEEALEQIRDLEVFLSWTDACERSDELRQDVRKAIAVRRQEKEADRQWNKIEAEQRERQEAEEEHRRNMELNDQRHEHAKELRTMPTTPTPDPRRRRR